MPDDRPPPTVLVLYGTRGCHLCEDAAELLDVLARPWTRREIGYDAALVARYGTRIPVLRRSDTGAELDWPFDADAVRTFTGGL